MTKAAGLLLAAGASTRMGRPKQLLPVAGSILLGQILQEALLSDLDRVVLVLGHEAAKIREALSSHFTHPRLRVVENSRYLEGMSTSILAGLSEVRQEYDHVMILLGDMPHITAPLINQLLHGYLHSRHPLGAVLVKGRRSHPVIIGRRFYGDLERLSGDAGARGLFAEYADQVFLLEREGELVALDIDTEADYESFLGSLERKP